MVVIIRLCLGFTQVPFDDHLGYGRVEVGIPPVDGLNGQDQFFWGRLFDNITGSSSFQGKIDVFLVFVPGQHQDFGFREALLDLAGGLQGLARAC